MAKENPKIRSVLKSLFQVSVDRLIRENVSPTVCSISIQFDPETGEVQVYDERERLLNKKVIFDWVGADAKDKHFTNRMLSVFRQVVENLVQEGIFAHSLFARPFSVRLVDEEFKKITDIYTIEEAYASPENEPVMKNLSRELDDFLKKLLSDVE